uniref:Uncharacterized protein n=1 Tax=Parascaris equorum TaxID=6256 RepID=A0A914S1K1_PAREQ
MHRGNRDMRTRWHLQVVPFNSIRSERSHANITCTAMRRLMFSKKHHSKHRHPRLW